MDKRIHDVFDAVSASAELKASTKQYLQAQRNRKMFTPAIRNWTVAVCTILLMVVGFGGYYGLTQTPVSYINIDVNPSIELTLNRFDKVIFATAYNDDGSLILETVSVKGMGLYRRGKHHCGE